MAPRRKATGGPAFYRAALTEAERLKLPKAREIEGIDEEIAMLRVKLFSLAEVHPHQADLLGKSMGMLMRMVALRYRLEPQSQEDLAESLAGVINGIGAAVGLGEFSGTPEG